MMKRVTIIAAAMMVVLLLNHFARANGCVIDNNSFEDNGEGFDIKTQDLIGWDVSLGNKFGGWVSGYWPTDKSFNLTLYSYQSPALPFQKGDMATVSQQVCLWDVNEIIFDLKLSSSTGKWDPNERSAVVLIDGNDVWDSRSYWPPPDDVNREYRNEIIPVDGIDDFGLYKLSLGIRVDVNEPSPDGKYYTDWDYIRFNYHCAGRGFPPGDFNRDCVVDNYDLKSLTKVWLDEIDVNGKYNLYGYDDAAAYGVINFFDFAIFADSCDGNMADLKMFADIWLSDVEPNAPYNLYRTDDIESFGLINFLDFTVFSDNWLVDYREQ